MEPSCPSWRKHLPTSITCSTHTQSNCSVFKNYSVSPLGISCSFCLAAVSLLQQYPLAVQIPHLMLFPQNRSVMGRLHYPFSQAMFCQLISLNAKFLMNCRFCFPPSLLLSNSLQLIYMLLFSHFPYGTAVWTENIYQCCCISWEGR